MTFILLLAVFFSLMLLGVLVDVIAMVIEVLFLLIPIYIAFKVLAFFIG